MGRVARGKRDAGDVEVDKSRMREKASKSYKEASESEEEAVVDVQDKDFSDGEAPSPSEESASDWDGESSGSEYGKKKKKTPAKKGKAGGRGRGRPAASPAKGKGRGRGRPAASASKNGKKTPVKRGRKNESEDEVSESGGESSGSEYGKKKAVVSPVKKGGRASAGRATKASPKKRKSASPAPEGRSRRGRVAASKSYKEPSEDEEENVSEEEKPVAKKAKLEPKKTEEKSKDKETKDKDEEHEEKENNKNDKEDESGSEDQSMEEEEEKDDVKKEEKEKEEKVEEKKEKEIKAGEIETKKAENENGHAKGDAVSAKPKNKTDTDYSEIDFKTAEKNSKGEEWNFKISCWNVSGIKAWLKKDGMTYLEKEDPDIFCLNEVKCNEKSKPTELKKMDKYPYLYWSYNAENAGHSGVAVFSKKEPKTVSYGLPEQESDSKDDAKWKKKWTGEGRIVTLEYEDFFIVNAYVPNSGSAEKTDEYPKGYPKKVITGERQRFDGCFREHIKELEKSKPVIVTGDLNVAHKEIDIANPKSNERSAGFTKEERDDFTKLLEETTLLDTFRELYPDKKDSYSFWSYRTNARVKNIGWRLDYFLMSKKLKDSLCDNVMRSEVFGSDHCPIVLFLKV